MSAGVIGFYYVFGAAEPEHRCRLPELVWPDDTSYYPVNATHRIYIDAYIPKIKNDTKWEKCVRYDNLNNTLINCPNGWTYDRSVFGYIFTEEDNLVCSSVPKKSWLVTLMQTGGFALLVIGSLADKFGRKKTTVVVTVLLFITCIITYLKLSIFVQK